MAVYQKAAWIQNQSELFSRLEAELNWDQPRLRIYGREVLTPRLVAYQGDRPYAYSGQTHAAQGWHPDLLRIRDRLRNELGEPFNVCLCNLYRDGADSVSAHSDDEAGVGPTIASVSLGAARKFRIRRKDKSEPSVTYLLCGGDLLVMDGDTQKTHVHWVPKTKAKVGSRINLTFRVQS